MFNSVFPNFHEKVEVLEFRNVYHKPLTVDVELFMENPDPRLRNGWGVIERTNSFLTYFIESQKVFPKLKKMMFFSSPDAKQILGAIKNNFLIQDREVMNPFSKYCELLIDFTLLTPNLEELIFVAPSEVGFKTFMRIVHQSPRRQFFKKLSFFSYDGIFSCCTKILNAKVFKRFDNFDDLREIDNYQYLCSQIIKEHFISCSKIQDYEGHEKLKNSKNTMFFKKEFEYVFGGDALLMFKKCPKLKEITIYGFTFYRGTTGTTPMYV